MVKLTYKKYIYLYSLIYFAFLGVSVNCYQFPGMYPQQLVPRQNPPVAQYYPPQYPQQPQYQQPLQPQYPAQKPPLQQPKQQPPYSQQYPPNQYGPQPPNQYGPQPPPDQYGPPPYGQYPDPYGPPPPPALDPKQMVSKGVDFAKNLLSSGKELFGKKEENNTANGQQNNGYAPGPNQQQNQGNGYGMQNQNNGYAPQNQNNGYAPQNQNNGYAPPLAQNVQNNQQFASQNPYGELPMPGQPNQNAVLMPASDMQPTDDVERMAKKVAEMVCKKMGIDDNPNYNNPAIENVKVTNDNSVSQGDEEGVQVAEPSNYENAKQTYEASRDSHQQAVVSFEKQAITLPADKEYILIENGDKQTDEKIWVLPKSEYMLMKIPSEEAIKAQYDEINKQNSNYYLPPTENVNVPYPLS